MARSEILGGFPHVVLLAIVRLNARADAADDHDVDDAEEEENEPAYGIAIRDEIQRRAKTRVSLGAVYRTLQDLEAKGYVESWMSDPEPVRGGRAKKFYRVRENGRLALDKARTVFESMWDGVELDGFWRIPAIRGGLP
jgi:hypothetical protein